MFAPAKRGPSGLAERPGEGESEGGRSRGGERRQSERPAEALGVAGDTGPPARGQHAETISAERVSGQLQPSVADPAQSPRGVGPGRRGGRTVEARSPLASCLRRLRLPESDFLGLFHMFYARHNPSMLNGVRHMLDKYPGRESDVFREMCRKYGVTLEEEVAHFAERGVLKQCLFTLCDEDRDGLLREAEMQHWARLLGFDGPDQAWHEEFLTLCQGCQADPASGIPEAYTSLLLDDESESGCFCTDDHLRMLLGEAYGQGPLPSRTASPGPADAEGATDEAGTSVSAGQPVDCEGPATSSTPLPVSADVLTGREIARRRVAAALGASREGSGSQSLQPAVAESLILRPRSPETMATPRASGSEPSQSHATEPLILRPRSPEAEVTLEDLE